MDALNLFLIKEKALVCVRDELLEREWGGGRGGDWGLGGQPESGSSTARWGSVLIPLTVPVQHPLPAHRRGLRQSLPPASLSQSHWIVPTLPSCSPSRKAVGSQLQLGGLGSDSRLPVLSLLTSEMDTRRWL